MTKEGPGRPPAKMIWEEMVFQSRTASARAWVAPAIVNARAVMSRSFILCVCLCELLLVLAESASCGLAGFVVVTGPRRFSPFKHATSFEIFFEGRNPPRWILPFRRASQP